MSLHIRDPVYSSFPSTKTRIDLAILEVGNIADSVGGVLLLVCGLDDLVEASRAGGDKTEHYKTVSLVDVLGLGYSREGAGARVLDLYSG